MGKTKSRKIFGYDWKLVLIVVVVAWAALAGVGILPFASMGWPSLGEGAYFRVEAIEFDHYYDPYETGMGVPSPYANWNYGYMNGLIFHVSEAPPSQMSSGSWDITGCTIDPDPADDGLPTLRVLVSSIGVSETEALEWKDYKAGKEFIRSGAVLRRYRFYIRFYTDSHSTEYDGTWKTTKIWLHFFTQRWHDSVYNQMGAWGNYSDFTTFISVKCIAHEIEVYTGSGKSGDWTKTKHDWRPTEGSGFAIYDYNDDTMLPGSFQISLPSEDAMRTGNRYQVTPRNHICIPLVIEDFGGYRHVGFPPMPTEMGDPLVTLTCEATVVSTHNYLLEEAPPVGPPGVPEDIWAYVKGFIAKYGWIGVAVVAIVAILFLRGITK